MDKNFLDKNTDKLFCLAEENLTLVYAVKSIKKTAIGMVAENFYKH